MNSAAYDAAIVRQMDSVEHIEELKLVGKKVADIEVKPEHIDRFPVEA